MNRLGFIILILAISAVCMPVYAAQNYYDILGVSKTADDKTIKKKFYQLAKMHHPDKSGLPKEQAEAKFAKINEAYETLSDPKTRKEYDNDLKYGRDYSSRGTSGSSGSSNSYYKRYRNSQGSQGGSGRQYSFDDLLKDLFNEFQGDYFDDVFEQMKSGSRGSNKESYGGNSQRKSQYDRTYTYTNNGNRNNGKVRYEDISIIDTVQGVYSVVKEVYSWLGPLLR